MLRTWHDLLYISVLKDMHAWLISDSKSVLSVNVLLC